MKTLLFLSFLLLPNLALSSKHYDYIIITMCGEEIQNVKIVQQHSGLILEEWGDNENAPKDEKSFNKKLKAFVSSYYGEKDINKIMFNVLAKQNKNCTSS